MNIERLDGDKRIKKQYKIGFFTFEDGSEYYLTHSNMLTVKGRFSLGIVSFTAGYDCVVNGEIDEDGKVFFKEISGDTIIDETYKSENIIFYKGNKIILKDSMLIQENNTQ